MDDERLKNLGGGGYFKELLERIRDIRASEKVFYRQVLEIYATSGGRTYTCPTKLIDGKLFFHFKKEWHSVAEFVSDHAEELVSEGGMFFLALSKSKRRHFIWQRKKKK